MTSTSIAKQTTTTARPSTLAPQVQARISLTFSRIVPVGGHGEIAEAQAPSEAERHALTKRLSDLRDSMAPAGRAVVETMVGSLLAGFPVGRGHRDEPDAVMKMFVQALSGLPAWTISAACSAWNRGEAGSKNTSFAPAPPDLRDLALKSAHEFYREQHMITAILGANVVPERESDETRAAVVARVRAFAETLGADDRPAKAPVEPAEDFEKWEARTKDRLRSEAESGGLRVSSEAIKALSPMMTDRDLDEWKNPPAKNRDAA